MTSGELGRVSHHVVVVNATQKRFFFAHHSVSAVSICEVKGGVFDLESKGTGLNIESAHLELENDQITYMDLLLNVKSKQKHINRLTSPQHRQRIDFHCVIEWFPGTRF